MNGSVLDEKPLHGVRWFGMPLPGIAFLVFTAVASVIISHYRLIWFDEYLILNTDSVSSPRQVLHIQRTLPLSLDPFAYHFFSYLSMRAFGVGAFGLRLPSLLGYLLMQVCLFVFVRRIATERAALFAMIFPSLLYAQYFTVDGRPYGLQLGLYALVLVCWQTAVRREGCPCRKRALITLAVALAIVLNTHYFAALLLIPLYAAEIVRTVQRRRVDLPTVTAILAGSAGIAFVLPFARGAAEFRAHYIALNVNPGALSLAYRTLLVFPEGAGGLGRAIFLDALALIFLWGAVSLLRQRGTGVLTVEYVLLITLTALPFFGYLMARFVTHSMYARYVIGATLGMVILEAIAVASLLNSRRCARVIFGVMLLVVVTHDAQRIRHERQVRKHRLATLVFAPEIKSAIMNSPDQTLYIQDFETFSFARFYETDPEIHSRLALVCSQEEEMRLMNQNTYWLQDTHLGSFTDARVASYESIASQPGEQIFVDLHDRLQWMDRAFASSDARVRYLGPAFGSVQPKFDGDFVAVTFPQAAK